MKLHSLALALVLVVLGTVSALPVRAASAPQPTAAMLKPCYALLKALDTRNASVIHGMFTNDAVIVDEFPPFISTGPNAGDSYLGAFKKTVHTMGLMTVTGRINKVIEFQQGGDRAYLALLTTVTATRNGKPMTERGVWTFVIQRSGAAWLMRSVTWSTSAPI